MKIRLILNTLECIHFASYSFLLCLTIFYLLTEAFNPFIFNMPTDIFWFKSTLLLRAICFSYSVFIFLFFFCLFFFFFWIACFPPFCVFLNQFGNCILYFHPFSGYPRNYSTHKSLTWVLQKVEPPAKVKVLLLYLRGVAQECKDKEKKEK